jgi:2-octaprenyl-6-methoxyphenol hydroxylase
MATTASSGHSASVDVAIVGGGMVGASLALALAGSGRSVLLVESVPFGGASQPSFDERTTALGNASRRIFTSLGLWEVLAGEAAAITTIHVSDAGRFGFSRLSAAEQGIEAFGFVVPNRRIGAALWERLSSAPDIALRVPARVAEMAVAADSVKLLIASDSGSLEAISARLVVGADGAHSQIRAAAGINASVEDYGQVAVVANVSADRPNGGVAYERFTRDGPLAVLPLHDGALAVIWACRPQLASELLALGERAYLQQLQLRFGWRAGRFVRAARCGSYPLKLTRAAATVAMRTVLIGNAAQALHPVAGQGFNLGLRDAAMLAEVIVGSEGDVGAPQLLQRFASWRAQDRRGVIGFTDALVKLFAATSPGVGVLRDFGLLLFDLAPPAKSALSRVSAGFGGPTPRLARGLALRRV